MRAVVLGLLASVATVYNMMSVPRPGFGGRIVGAADTVPLRSVVRERFLTLVTAGAVVVAGGVVYWLLPAADAPRHKLAQTVQRETEGARRMLDAYSRSLGAVASDPVEPVAGALTADRITGLLESDNRPAAKALDTEADRLNKLRRGAYNQIRALDDRLTALDPSVQVTPPAPVRFANNVSAMKNDMTQGVTERQRAEKNLDALLNQATDRLKQAVATQVGDLTGRDSLAANRLLAGALMQQGAKAQREASRCGLDLLQVIDGLSAISLRAAELHAATGVVEQSEIDRRIDRARQKVADAQAVLNERSRTAAELDHIVQQTRDRIAEQESIADRARAAMDALEMRGLRYEDPSAVEQFRSQYEQLASSYRGALRRAEALKHGTLGNARIDDSGDLLTGRYVSESDDRIDYEPGLDEYARRLAEAQNAETEAKRILEQTRREHARLEDLRQRLVAVQQNAAQTLSRVADDARTMVDRYKKLKLTVTGAEDEALRYYDQAARTFKQAAATARQRVSDVPVDAGEDSAQSLVREDRWLTAQINCQYADAQVAGAAVLLDRMHRLSQARQVIEDIAGSIKGLADPGVPAAEIDEAQSQGRDRLDKAITALESASRDLQSHWTVTATLAAADYMLSLFGDPSLVSVSIANYQNVVNGREDNPLVRPFKERLEQLRSR